MVPKRGPSLIVSDSIVQSNFFRDDQIIQHSYVLTHTHTRKFYVLMDDKGRTSSKFLSIKITTFFYNNKKWILEEKSVEKLIL